jgi:hypothetical protein
MSVRPVGAALAACLSLAVAVPAHAAARVFVSVFGSDGGDCSNRNTPCRTFSAAITQVDAGGEVIVIDTGSYGGATITKSVKINVPVGVVAFTASPLTIAAGMSDVVVLRGLTIKALTPGTDVGILVGTAAAVHVENCLVDGWDIGIRVNGAGPPEVSVTDTIVRNVASDGLFVSGAARGSVDSSRFRNSGGCGLLISDGNVSVSRSVATGSLNGFCAVNAEAILNLDGSVAANNDAGGFRVASGATLRAARSMATGNGTGFLNSGATFESLGDNLVRGNTTNVSGTITVVGGQ